MSTSPDEQPVDGAEIQFENSEWRISLDDVHQRQGAERVQGLLAHLRERAQQLGVQLPHAANTPYINTIPATEQPVYPGSREIERRIKSLIRWNAMAMVVRANRESAGIGGHISTFASCATLYEVGFNHFFRAKSAAHPGDLVYFQGHSAPGIYARAFLEGRLEEHHLKNFRRELADGGGLSSYPHPYLMPHFWQFPTVSMGLAPLMAIYQARFIRYAEDRGLVTPSDQKVWAFLGDGELDEPESLGAITLAAREGLDNLIFVVNCNLQRLDGPVRGNGKIIQELEAAFRGAGWNVIKVIWGSDWDPLLAQDSDGQLVERMGEVVDGQYQMYSVAGGHYIRNDFFGKTPELKALVDAYADEQLMRLGRGGHDPAKVYAAYAAAVAHAGGPTVILAKTIKGYGLGEAGEGRNVTHQQKKLNEKELRQFRSRFGIPIPDDTIAEAPFYRPAADSEEISYLKARRRNLGGQLPARSDSVPLFRPPGEALYREYYEGSKERAVATTMVAVGLLAKLLKDRHLGGTIVPIVPDEARTFGMESLFRQVGIYSHKGQIYEPVDKESLLYYREAENGQILEEGITEAGAMSSFIAAGTAYSSLGINMVPIFLFYSMFGFQRIGDLIWAAGDAQARGFLMGATAGRTTLAGEGLQHQDGHSHLLAFPNPSVRAYDPAFAYELAVIVQEGLRQMLEHGHNLIYYLTITNEVYPMPPKPDGVDEGILKGIYRFRSATKKRAPFKAHLLGSGAILNEVLKAQALLENNYGVAAEVWSVTSYKALYEDATATERWNWLHPGEAPRDCFLARQLKGAKGIYVAASDYVKTLPAAIAKYLPGPLTVLGTDGYGLSETREALRDHFEVDARHIAFAALAGMLRAGKLKPAVVERARGELEIDPDKHHPFALRPGP
ncbi:MAG: pyruvate dehydrogenase (acetyl-transferring), homodimeric type [Desulfosarcinaceae bacterium]|nr:pyruvate dehydrogenase (acetyl-transferring), homodimeric type [Desulfosarcinaceae bacterium]